MKLCHPPSNIQSPQGKSKKETSIILKHLESNEDVRKSYRSVGRVPRGQPPSASPSTRWRCLRRSCCPSYTQRRTTAVGDTVPTRLAEQGSGLWPPVCLLRDLWPLAPAESEPRWLSRAGTTDTVVPQDRAVRPFSARVNS